MGQCHLRLVGYKKSLTEKVTFEEGLEKDERVSVKVGGWRENSRKCKVLMLEPGWKTDYLQKTQVLEQSQVGWVGGERDGGRPREERWRR